MKDATSLINILFDARKIGDGGIGVYIENLVHGFLSLSTQQTSGFNLTLLVPVLKQGLYSLAKEERIKLLFKSWQDRIRLIPEPAGKYSVQEYLLLAKRHREILRHTSIFHSPHYTLPFFLNVPTVVTVHDIIHITHPDTFWHKISAPVLIASALKRANHVITVSEASKQRIMETFGDIKVPIAVIPNAAQTGIYHAGDTKIAAYCKSKCLSTPYYVFVGSDRPHKGFRALYKAWAMYVKKCEADGKPIPILVAIGDRYSSKTKAEILSLGIEAAVHFIEHVNTEELSILYSGAEAVIIPSLEEGFGLMAIEALICNTRIIATPLPSIKETCGSIAYFAQDFSSEALFKAILECAEDKQKEKRIRDGNKISAKFSNESTIQKTLLVYQEVTRRFRGWIVKDSCGDVNQKEVVSEFTAVDEFKKYNGHAA